MSVAEEVVETVVSSDAFPANEQLKELWSEYCRSVQRQAQLEAWDEETDERYKAVVDAVKELNEQVGGMLVEAEEGSES